MQVETFEYTTDGGWTVDTFPSLDSERALVLVFGARRYLEDSDPIGELIEAYPEAVVAGCSSSGEIHGSHVSDDTLTVAVARFDDGRLGSAVESVQSMDDSHRVGESLGRRVDDDDLTAVLVLSNGTMVNGTQLIEGINAVLDSSVVVTGGLAGDGDRFEKTWVLDEASPRPDIVSVIGFYGDNFQVSHGSQGGWDRFGPERTITKSSGNVLYELDGKPALELYKRYLGDQADELPASGLLFPLEIKREGEERLVRTILAIDEDEQSMTFAGDIPEGVQAQLMKANFDRLVGGASQAAKHSTDMIDHDDDALAVAISCVGRRLILKERTVDELEAVLDQLPPQADLVGFYSYGELSPHVEGDACDLHNQTMTLTVISENAVHA